MKKLIVPICILLLSASAFSQTRSRTASKRGSQSSKASTRQAAADVRTDGASRVAIQIKDLTRFVYVLGGVAKGLEQVDEAARRNEASPAALEQQEKNKASVKSSLRNVREGLDQLEIYFRSTPALEQYYLKLAGSAAGAAVAEDEAATGHFE